MQGIDSDNLVWLIYSKACLSSLSPLDLMFNVLSVFGTKRRLKQRWSKLWAAGNQPPTLSSADILYSCFYKWSTIVTNHPLY